jgi:hypothetical protein
MTAQATLPACGNPKCKVSTGLHDGLTFGSGRLSDGGYWSQPCQVCARSSDTRRKADRADMARRMRAEGQGKRAIRRYIATSDWLWLLAWPFP